jgi:hypothetical protein
MRQILCAVALALVSIEARAAGAPFVHPGLMHSQADLALVRQKLAAGEEPWTSAWKRLRSDPIAGLRYTPKPMAHVSAAPYGKDDVGASQMMRDASAAYQHYVYEKGLQMPYTRQVLDKIRPEGWSPVVPEVFGTLTCFQGQPRR